jgi:hypothetical protein
VKHTLPHLNFLGTPSTCGVAIIKDGNGDPIPESPQGILSLEDEDGDELIPTGMKMVGKLSPSGMVGTGMVPWSPTPIPAP